MVERWQLCFCCVLVYLMLVLNVDGCCSCLLVLFFDLLCDYCFAFCFARWWIMGCSVA